MRGLQRIGAVLALAIPLAGFYTPPPLMAPTGYTSVQLPADQYFGKWVVSYIHDDTRTYNRTGIFASLPADNNPLISLHIYCWAHNVDGRIDWDQYLGSGDWIDVEYRTSVGTRFSRNEYLREPGDTTAFDLKYDKMVRRLIGTTRLVVRTQKHDKDLVTAVFDTRQADAAIGEVFRYCGLNMLNYGR